MSKDVGVWIDHKKAVIVSIVAGEVTTRTLTSDVGAHPHSLAEPASVNPRFGR
jgi:hypothetical protein